MDLSLVNYEEFLHEPYIPEPVFEPRFLLESALSQVMPSQAHRQQFSQGYLPECLSLH